MEDRERVTELVGRKVAVRLNSVEIMATLEEASDVGIVLSEVGELGRGPTMFCPWGSLVRVRERPPGLAPPHEEVPEPEEPPDERSFYESREATAEEVAPGPSIEGPKALARNLERVVPVAQKRTVGGITVALSSLELFGEGVGILHWRISHDPISGDCSMLEPDFEIRDGSGRLLPWSPRGASASDREADGTVEVRRLPGAGEVRVEVSRVASGAWDGEEGGPSHDGPWTFTI